MIARSHPSDSATSFVVQGAISVFRLLISLNYQIILIFKDFQVLRLLFLGIMEFLTSQHGIAQELRKDICFKIFPMLNPDGVFLGNTR